MKIEDMFGKPSGFDGSLDLLDFLAHKETLQDCCEALYLLGKLNTLAEEACWEGDNGVRLARDIGRTMARLGLKWTKAGPPDFDKERFLQPADLR